MLTSATERLAAARTALRRAEQRTGLANRVSRDIRHSEPHASAVNWRGEAHSDPWLGLNADSVGAVAVIGSLTQPRQSKTPYAINNPRSDGAQALRMTDCESAGEQLWTASCGRRTVDNWLWITWREPAQPFEQFSTGSSTPVETGEAHRCHSSTPVDTDVENCG